MKSRRLRGFALPTVLIASIVMLTVLLVAVSSTAAVRASLTGQYYNQLSKTAGEAGAAYAKACLAANNGVPLWTDANPLMPNTNCSGVQLAGFTCPTLVADARCSVSTNVNNVVATFSIKLPPLDSNGKATSVNSSGMVQLLRTSDSSVWRQYNEENVIKLNTPSVSVLVVGGGGGGGMDMGGGGGGGGVVYNSAFPITAKTYTVTVGAGGNGGPAGGTYGQPSLHQFTIPASNGQNSSFDTIVAKGGGYGASSVRTYTPNSGQGGPGGSGGGGSGYNAIYDGSGAGTAGQGYRGGNGGTSHYSGGGGGAGGAGADGNNQPNGGIGISNSILGTVYYWGGGGGGSGYSACGGNGGLGGGGGGAVCTTAGGGSALNSGSGGGGGVINAQTNMPGGDGGANTGGGGGGGSHYNINNKGGNGGSGIVIISYPTGSITATGGTVTKSGLNTIHTFYSSGSFTVIPTATSVKLLVVAGGGGGGAFGGGGGAGGLVYNDSYGVSTQSYNVVVGDGGNGDPTYNSGSKGSNGGNSSFGNLTAIGGGGGGSRMCPSTCNGVTGGAGGSGGGGSPADSGSIGVAGVSNTNGQGNNGGQGSVYGWGAGGGGGSGGIGGSATANNPSIAGNGGIGLAYSISGSSVYYAGGGGGNSHDTGTAGLGGNGGGGNGSKNTANGVAGTANTGGGGGGGSAGAYAGGKGGSGIVIVSYPTGSITATGGTITYSGGYTIHTFTSSGTFVVGSTFQVYTWGAGGAGGTVGGWTYGAAGGAGAAAQGKISSATGTSYSIVVGGGGAVNSYNYNSSVCVFGGGGCASWNNSDNRYGSGGGGYSGVFSTNTISQSTALLIAAGGGGGGSSRAGTGNAGGAGGGLIGQNGYSPYDGKAAYGGNGGTQSAAGANASCTSPNTTGEQTALQGGRSLINGYGGAGGGGYWGGSGGGYSESNTMGGGGGGSSYYNPSYVSDPVLTGGNGTTPGDSGNSYRGSAGNAGAVAAAGNSGVVVIIYPTGSITATGGTVTTSGSNTIHTFTSNGTFAVGSVATPPGPTELNSYPILLNDASLVSYYRMEGNSNDSKSAFNGANTNISFGATYGKFGQGAWVPGTPAKIMVAHNAALLPRTITVMMWAKTSLGMEVQKDWGSGWNLYIDQGVGKAIFSITDQVNYKKAVSITSVKDNLWHLIAGTYDGTTVKVYVDGRMENSKNIAGTIATGTSAVYIGANNYGGYDTGSVDDVAIFNRALSDDEIFKYYNGL